MVVMVEVVLVLGPTTSTPRKFLLSETGRMVFFISESSKSIPHGVVIK